MVFELHQSVFIDSNRGKLMSLLYNALQGYAYLEFDISDPVISDWINKNNIQDWAVAYDSWLKDAAIYPQYNKVVVIQTIKSSFWEATLPQITLKDAAHLIVKPCEIWLENGRNDGAFISLALEVQQRVTLQGLLDTGRVSFNGLGGIGELKKNLAQDINSLGYRNKRFVMCDSDAPTRGTPQPDANFIIEQCTKHKIQFHCLERRAIENYLPVDYLISNIHPNTRPKSTDYRKYQAFKQMTDEQRHHFHMKSGINDKTCSDSKLYDDLDDETLGLIMDGFSSKFADSFLTKHEDKDKIRTMLVLEDVNNELSKITNQLIDYIRVPAYEF